MKIGEVDETPGEKRENDADADAEQVARKDASAIESEAVQMTTVPKSRRPTHAMRTPRWTWERKELLAVLNVLFTRDRLSLPRGAA